MKTCNAKALYVFEQVLRKFHLVKLAHIWYRLHT